MKPNAFYTTPQSDFIVRCWPFLLLAFAYILAALALQSYYGTDQLHLMLATTGHYPLLDTLFSRITDLGDAPFAFLIAVFVIWRYRKQGLCLYVSASVLQLAIVQVLKRSLFAQHLRPIYYFQQQGITLHDIAEVNQGMYYHFPSGHTAMTFTAFLCLAVFSRHRWWQALCAMFAVSVAYSRLYLAQHFILDTVAGAFIGVFCVVVSYYICLYVGRCRHRS